MSSEKKGSLATPSKTVVFTGWLTQLFLLHKVGNLNRPIVLVPVGSECVTVSCTI